MFTQLGARSKATIFYLLAFGMALLLAIFGQGMGERILVVSMSTPLVATLLMLLVVTPDGYRRAGWTMLGIQRPGWRAWPLAIFGPLAILGVTYAIVWTTGIGRLDLSGWGGPLTVDSVLNFVISFAAGLLAALMEEIGWRGYLLPHLLPLGRTRALVLSGFLHGLWHLPLILLTPFYHAEGNRLLVATLFLLTLTAAGLLYGYMRLVSDSVWPATIAHGVFNTAWSFFTGITVAVASPLLLEYLAGESGLLTLMGVTVLSIWFIRRLPRQSESASAPTVNLGKTLVGVNQRS